MRKKGTLSVMLVSLMLLSVLTAMVTVGAESTWRGASVKTAAAPASMLRTGPDATYLSLSTSNSYPATGQTFTLRGQLTLSATGAGLGDRWIYLQYWDGSNWVNSANIDPVKGDGNGYYSFSLVYNSPGTRYLRTAFIGAGTLDATQSSSVTEYVGMTTLSIASSNYQPGVNGYFTVSGYLKTYAGYSVPDRTVYLQYWDGSQWVNSANNPPKQTDNAGYYSFVNLSYSSTGTKYLRTAFTGDSTYYGTQSSSITEQIT
jgi:hypothetical protein